MTTRKWCFRDLFVDHVSGKLRETAVWSNIGKAVMTWAFVKTVWTNDATEWLWLAYGGIVVAHEASARFFNQRQQQISK